MSPVAVARRTSARIILIIVVALMTTLVLFSGGRIGAVSFAQQSTTSPGFSIKWVNPDDGASTEISGKDDEPGGGTDTSYHLVAWVSGLPQSYSVVFQYQIGSNAPVTIGNGTLRGNDTFDLFWPAEGSGSIQPFPSDGSVTMIAILFSGGNEVARDTQSATVNNQTPSGAVSDPRDNQGETVEIVDPGNVDELGFYDPPGDARPATALYVRHSAGVGEITAYYTTTAPGADPQWTSCGTESASAAADGVRCTLASGVSASGVTGVAAVASDEPIPETPDVDSGDAHRVTGYDADPGSVTISYAGGTTNGASNACSVAITSKVLDQRNNNVVGVNVDVHAQGPNDTLAFDDNDSSGNSTSASKAPENHATESARNCEATSGVPGASGAQGWHEQGTMDIKHIESVNESDDSGNFSFRLFSGAAGGTQFTAWADEDGNDRMCLAEAQGDGSYGWDQSAPPVSGVPEEESNCPRPTSTATTQSPTTQSPTSASPSGSPSSPTPATPRTVTLGTSRSRVKAGQEVTLSGQITSNDASCEDNEFVSITRHQFGEGSFEAFRSATTDANGSFEITIRPTAGANYRATATAHDDCQESSSSPVGVQVKVDISLDVNDASPQRGATVRFTVRVDPDHDGTKVILQRKKGKRWVPVATETLNRKSRAVFEVDANWKGRRDFRAKWKAQDDDHESNKSSFVTVRTR